MSKLPIISPSLLSANFAHLEKDIEMLNGSACDWLHVDVMDGRFVPNISFGFPVMKVLKQLAQKPLDVHLMIVEPEKYIQEFADAGATHISVHIEASTHLHRTLEQIKKAGAKAGVAINPHTPVESLRDVAYLCDLVLVMSVNPGFGGQQFIERTLHKTKSLKQLLKEENSSALIEIDGGVNQNNASKLMQSGADALVAGNFIFSSTNPTATIADLKNLTW